MSALMGLVTLTFDLQTVTGVASKVVNLPNLHTLAFWVLELFAMYATDGQTDGWTKAMLTAPFTTGEGIMMRLVQPLSSIS